MPIAHLNGINLNYEVYGSGFPLVVAHGFSGAIRSIRPQIPLSDKCQVILYEARGHGKTDSPADPSLYSEDHFIEDLRALLDHLKVPQAVLVGLSMGGFVAIAFYFKYPERVRALVLCGAGPGIRRPEQRDAWNADRTHVAELLMSGGPKAYVEQYLKQEATAERLAELSGFGLANTARGMLVFNDSRYIDRLEEIAVPTFSIVGERDQTFVSTAQYVARKVPGAQYAMIPDAGHPANQDQPELFNAEVRRFLDGLDLS